MPPPGPPPVRVYLKRMRDQWGTAATDEELLACRAKSIKLDKAQRQLADKEREEREVWC